MGLFDKLYALLGEPGGKYVVRLEEKCQGLILENAALKHELEVTGILNQNQRIASLEAALGHMIKIAKCGANEYCDPMTQAEIRTAEAILENKL